MKSFFSLLTAAVLVTALGCKEGTPGGPGAKPAPSSTSSTTSSSTTTTDTPSSPDTSTTTITTTPDTGKTENPVVDPENTFRLDAPNLAVTIKQGETKEVTIGISRATNFQEDVTLEFGELPKGVTIEPADPMIKAGDKEVKINVKADAEAALNDFTIKVIGHPTKGADATTELKLTVEKP